MDYFAQQLINGLVLGSIYGLIAIGYTMVYGIVGMINFAHGDIFMIGGFIALITFLILVSFGLTAIPLILLIVLLVSMAITALYGWTVERIAYRPLRHSFRLAPMLSAIGMSFVLTNYSQVAQGARVKPVPPIITGGYTLHEGAGGFVVQLSNIQIIVVITTVVLLALFTWLVSRTRLGRDMRACEQDQTMAALLGVDVDRTISMTFVIGAALAAVAGMMYLLYYGLVDFFMGFVAGIKAFTAAVLGGIGSLPGAMLGGLADRPDRDVVVGLLLGRVQGRRRLLDPDRRADLPSDRPARPARSRKSLTGAPRERNPRRTQQASRALRRRLHPQESPDQRAGRAGAVFADDRRAHRSRPAGATDLLDAVRRSRRHGRDRVRRQHRRRIAAAMVGTGRHRQRGAAVGAERRLRSPDAWSRRCCWSSPFWCR